MTPAPDLAGTGGVCARGGPADAMPLGEVLDALVHGWCLAAVVPLALDAAERDPLVSSGRCPGDVVRALMEVPGAFWVRFPALYGRYRTVLRANADARRGLPPEERLKFWVSFADLDHTARAGRTP